MKYRLVVSCPANYRVSSWCGECYIGGGGAIYKNDLNVYSVEILRQRRLWFSKKCILRLVTFDPKTGTYCLNDRGPCGDIEIQSGTEVNLTAITELIWKDFEVTLECQWITEKNRRAKSEAGRANFETWSKGKSSE